MRIILSLFLLFFFQQAVAQQVVVEDVVIEGLRDETLEGLVKVSITPAVGSKISFDDLEQIKLEVLQLGFFKSVDVSLQVEGKNRLTIKVVPNPLIKSISFSGNVLIPTTELSRLLDERLNLVPGVILNNARLEEAKQLIIAAYRQNAPFTPKVELNVSPESDGQVEVKLMIDETTEIKDVKVTGSTLIPAKELQDEFKTLLEKGKFDADLYIEAIDNINRRYNKLGYRGSGVALDLTEITSGVLNVSIREFKIASIDLTKLGIEKELSVKPGDFFNYEKLLSEVQALSKDQTKQVKLAVEQASADEVAISFVLEESLAEPIKEIKIEGNTLISSDELLKTIKQKPSDRFNTTLANEADFGAIYTLYGDKGYLIVAQPDFTFKDGVYSIRLNEVRIVGYELSWRGNHRTQDFVITRELPEPNSLFNRSLIAKGLGNLYRAGLLASVNPTIKVPDINKPNEVIFVLNMQEGQTLTLTPGISYSTFEGLSGEFRLSESNLFGLNHIARVSLSGGPNDAGQNFQGNLSYTIPWLYVDFLDFKRVATAVSFFAGSNVSPNRILQDPALPAGQNPRTYSVRASGLGLSISRPILENLALSFGYNFQYEENFLETKADTTYYISDDVARTKLPVSNLTNFFELKGDFSTKNSAEFPTGGVAANASVGYGFGQSDQALSWFRTTAGARTYLGFGWDNKGEFGFGPGRNLALALRLDAGAITGTAPGSRQFSLGGAGAVESSVLRGFDFSDLTGDVFVGGSAELRFDFGLKTAVTNGLLAIGFVDFGNAWGTNATRREFKRDDGSIVKIQDGIQFGYGLGVQINIGIGSFQLPALRFDYGFSQYYPGGKFYFRLTLPF